MTAGHAPTDTSVSTPGPCWPGSHSTPFIGLSIRVKVKRDLINLIKFNLIKADT